MRVSRARMAENRLRILEEARRLFQEKGCEAVTLSEVMAAAGLTHGGFYGHFRSKEDLVAEMLKHRTAQMAEALPDLAAIRAAYLSEGLCSAPETGCHLPAMAAQSARHSAEVRAALTEAMQAQITRLSGLLSADTPADARREAICQWAAMLGANVIARASGDAELSREVLSTMQAWLAERD